MRILRPFPPAPPRRAPPPVAHGLLALLVCLGLSPLHVVPAASAAQDAAPQLRVGGASDSESAVSAPFLTELAIKAAAGLTTEELKEKIKTDPLLLETIAKATAASAAATATTSTVLVGNVKPPGAIPKGQECLGVGYNATVLVGNVKPPGAIPKGQEYLGVGYNALTGNPRGDLSSNFDPGFGFRVIAITPGAVKVRGLLEPTTASIKPAKMCSFSSEAKDISSVKDMQDTLNKESSDDTTASLSLKVKGFGFDSSNQFSKSEKMNKFQQDTENEQTVSFEASATCIDFRETMNPYVPKKIDPNFNVTIEALGAAIGSVGSYDSSLHKAAFAEFFKVYGTHYITEIDMGGKYIITTEMSAKDVSSLTTEQVDVASALSFDQSFSFMGSADEKNDSLLEEKRKYHKPTCCNNTLMTAPPQEEKEGDLFGDVVEDILPFSASVGVQSTHKRSSSRSSRDSESVKSKMTKQSVYTLGGLPPTNNNWATWAASVEKNPMPVSYKYAPIWELPEFKDIVGLRKAYVAAALDIYNKHLIGASEYGEPAFRSAIVRSSGEPINRSAQTSDRRKRVSLELELLSSTDFAHDTVQVCIDEEESQDVKNSWSSFVTATEVEEGFFACGLRAKIDPQHKHLVHKNHKGLSGLDVRFCSIDQWTNQETKRVYAETSGWVQPWKMCGKDQYIVQVKPTVKFDTLGIESLAIKCATKDGYTPSDDVDKFHDIVPLWPSWAKRVGTAMEAQPASVIPGRLIRSLRTQYEEGSGKGIKGMEVVIDDADSEKHVGPPSPIFFYRSYWDLRTTKASPIFATPVRGRISKSAYESSQLSFTSQRGGLMVESLSMYAYMDDASRPKLAVTDFKNDVSESDLQPFSMLVSNELNDEAKEWYGLQGRFIRGIVHPDSSDVCFSQESDYEVEYEDSKKPNLATVILKGFSSTSSHVSLLVSPIWFPSASGKYATNAGDVAIATSPCEATNNVNSTDWKCYVHVGSEGNSNAEEHLGFSFIALGLSDDDKASKGKMPIGYYGTVVVNKDNGSYDVDTSKSKTSKGVTPSRAFIGGKSFNVMVGEGDLTEININDQVTGGVRLTFNPPFKDIPSIIVSPVVGREASLSRHATDILNLPSTVVEHVTTKEALIRVGLVNTLKTGEAGDTEEVFTPISFNFAAVGPLKSTPSIIGKYI